MLLRSTHRSYVTVLAVFAVVILGIPAYQTFDNYVSVDRVGIHDAAEESAAYRRELLQKYVVIAEERPLWGWGSPGFPVVDGMTSIDNQYLLLALNSGAFALAALALILLWVPIRLCRFGLSHSGYDPTTSLALTLMGIFILCAISISTVYLGAQTEPLLFFIAGWSEALLLAPMLATAPVLSPARKVAYRFERVMV
jgi:O-antigen ligase